MESLADGILAFEVAIDERLIHDDDGRRCRAVVVRRLQEAPGEETLLRHLEESRCHAAVLHSGKQRWVVLWHPLIADIGVGSPVHIWDERDRARARHSRYGTNR